MSSGLLSVVIPSYNEEMFIPETAQKVGSILREADIPYEILFVDDGSKDKTAQKIREAAAGDPHVRGISFSRNFGKEAAMHAGLSEAGGDCAVVIDCDLQHPPEKIVDMYRLWQQGYEIIEGRKRSRGREAAARRGAANSFNRIFEKMSGINLEDASDFRLLDRRAVDAVLSMKERNAFFRALSSWVGFKTATVTFDVRERKAGVSKWSTRKLIGYALKNIASFTAAPLQFVTCAGVILFLLSVILGIRDIVLLIMGAPVGASAGIIFLLLFIGGLLMIAMGIAGFYIARIYEEVKERPRYIIAEKINAAEKSEK